MTNAQTGPTTLIATDTYYTFAGNVSSNSGTRLLGDKATVIGFEGFETISFLQFDPSAIADALPDQSFRATLTLQHDPSLASTLIPATDDRPVNLSIYDLDAPFDPTKDGGNLEDIDYGANGGNAIATTSIGDAGLYRWNITELVAEWAIEPTNNDGLAISGVFGNVNIDDRNSYGIFYAEGTTEGLEPVLTITPILEGTDRRDVLQGDNSDSLIKALGGNDRVFGNGGNDEVFGGDGNDIIRGNRGDDLLSGGAGRDTLEGGVGDDILMGVTGRDTLKGGAGNDIFVFGNGDGRDTIVDYQDGQDRIGLVEGELIFDDLKFNQRGALTFISVSATGERLATVRSPKSALTADDFVMIPDVSDIS